MIIKGTTKAPDDKEPAFIEFIEFHEAPLQDGEYTIKLTQTVTTKEGAGEPIDKNNVFTAERNIYVAGDRFNLKPDDVYTVFPPAGSLGQYSNVLPHIVLNRSTVPWERLAVALTNDEEKALNKLENERSAAERQLAASAAKKKKTPWLALLHFADGEIVHLEVTTLGKLRSDASIWPTIKKLEIGQHDDEKVEIIDVKPETLDNLMPSYDELRYQAHVRQGKDEQDKTLGDEKAILVCNRLPKQGSNSTIHLVSVEHRYTEAGFDVSHKTKDGNIRLISLKSWRFASLTEKESFKGLLTHLNHPFLFDVPYTAADARALNQGIIPQTLHDQFKLSGEPLTGNAIVVDGESNPWRIHDLIHSYWVSHSADTLSVHLQDTEPSHSLRLPDTGNAHADTYLRMGAVAAPHFFRQGDQSFSWYHGPLSPYSHARTVVPNDLFPVRSADALLRYNKESGMFDVSYAAAWELGRLMALKSRHFALSLYQWKRAHVQQVKQLEQHHLYAHLPVPDMPESSARPEEAGQEKTPKTQSDLPNVLEKWLAMTSLLHNVPFNYLVPDERMLPVESIRYFTVNPLWIASLVDGAFSIGRVSPADHASDGQHAHKVAAIPQQQVSGVLIRSAVVAGWPDLLLDGYDYTFADTGKDEWEIPADKKLTCLRLERLSPNVLIALFAGDAKVIDVHQKPQAIHFGVDKTIDDDGNETFSKQLRDAEGNQGEGLLLSTIPFSDKERRIVDIDQLFSDVKSKSATLKIAGEFTAAQFALEMIEGVQKVRFVREGGTS